MSATLPPQIRFQPLAAGSPIPGGKVYFYAAGTTTPQAVYADDGTTSLGSTLVLDANGATDFRLGSGLSYKINLTNANDVQILGWPKDNIQDLASLAVLASDLASTATGKGAALVGTKSPLAGSAATNQHIKNWASVSIVDFMTPAQWAAWQADQALYPMHTYMQAAIDALTVGGEIYCPPGQYRLESAINMTATTGGRASYGIRIYGAGDRATVFNAVHTGHVFDCTGAQFVNFEKFGVTGNAVTTPKTAFLFARNSTHNSAGQCRMLGVGVRGNYSVACLYNYAAEEFRTQNCWFYNSQANTPAVIHTDDNVLGVTSTFVTIDTGHQSNTEFKHIGTAIASDQATGTAAALVLRGVLAFTFRDGFMVQTPGAGSKYVQIDATTLGSSHLTFDNIMIDASSNGVEKFIYHHGTQECPKITVNQILSYGLKSAATGGYIYYADTGASTTGAVMTSLPSGCAVRFYAVTTSDLSLPNEKLEIAYSSSNNRVLVKYANVTLTRPDLATANSFTYSDYGATTPNLRSGAGSPYAVVTPLFVGECYVDTTAYAGNTSTYTLWQATGVTNGYWVPVASIFCHGTGSPVGAVTPSYRGQFYLDDSTNKWWMSHGTLNSQWAQITN